MRFAITAFFVVFVQVVALIYFSSHPSKGETEVRPLCKTIECVLKQGG